MMKKIHYVAALLLAALMGVAASRPARKASAPGTETLTEHLIQQLTSRTNGDFNFTGPLAGGNCFSARPVLAANFWLRDVTNILAASLGMMQFNCLYSFATSVTPISPRHVIGAAHAGGQGLDLSVWLLPDGSLYTNTAVVRPDGQPARERVPGTDIMITLMQKTNPCVCRYLPDVTAKVALWNTNAARRAALATGLNAFPPPFVRFHLTGYGGPTNHTSFVSAGRGMGSFGGITTNHPAYFGDYSRGDGLIGGDSGSPAYAIINNEAALICLATTSGGGPAIARYTNQINAVMAKLSKENHAKVYTLQACDVSRFPEQ